MADIAYGFHPVRELLRHRPHDVERILLAKGRRSGRRRAELESLAARHRIPIVQSSEVELRELAGKAVHNGVVAALRSTSGSGVSHADSELVVLVEDVQDPRNLGALLRVCEGAGVGRVLIRDRGAAPITPLVVKASAGAVEWLEIDRVTNAARALEELKSDGYWTYGAAAEGDPPWSIDLTGKVVLAIGGEQRGLRALTRKTCDRLVGLPMRGRISSLNLATAAAGLLFEAVRQRTVDS